MAVLVGIKGHLSAEPFYGNFHALRNLLSKLEALLLEFYDQIMVEHKFLWLFFMKTTLKNIGIPLQEFFHMEDTAMSVYDLTNSR